jgi:hypothetical protein
MHAAILTKWHEFSEPLEGRVHWLYADVKQLLTAGVGNLADPVALALQMPWKLPDGTLAPELEVRQQWAAVKAQAAYLSKRHYKYAAPLSTIRLTDEDIDTFVAKRLATTERALRKYFPDWNEFPADAQLGCLSMAWAVGDGFPTIFKNFTRAANQHDWTAAIACCRIKTDNNPGVIPRNRRNELCFENAATVIERSGDRSVLHWPERASEAKPAPSAPSPAITAEDRARHAAFMVRYAQTVRDEDHLDKMAELGGMASVPPEGGRDA